MFQSGIFKTSITLKANWKNFKYLCEYSKSLSQNFLNFQLAQGVYAICSDQTTGYTPYTAIYPPLQPCMYHIYIKQKADSLIDSLLRFSVFNLDDDLFDNFDIIISIFFSRFTDYYLIFIIVSNVIIVISSGD